MGEHGTREDELDDLLRGEVLVDLFRVVRQALRALARRATRSRRSRSSTGSSATADVARRRRVASSRSRSGSRRGERRRSSRRSAPTTRTTAARSTSCTAGCSSCGRPELEWRAPPEEREVKEETKERLEERERVEAELLEGAEEGEPRWLLAHLLEYHRREEKPQWWEYFHHLELDEEELFEDARHDRRARARRRAGAGQAVARLHASRSRRRSTRSAATAVDPATEKRYNVTVDDERGLVTLRRGVERDGRAAADGADPAAAASDLGAARRRAPLRARTQDALPGARRDPRAAAAARAARRDARRGGARASTAATSSSRARRARGRRGRGARMAIELMRRGQRVGITVAQPQGDPQVPARTCATRRSRQGFAFKGRKKCERRRGDRVRGRVRRLHATTTTSMLDEELQLARRHVVPVLARGARPARRHAVRRRGRAVRARRRARGRDGGAEPRSCSATRTSSPQVSQGSHPPGANASVLAAPARRGRDGAAGHGPLPRARRGGCGRR